MSGVSAFGALPDGRAVQRITLRGGGLVAQVLTLGATLQDLRLEGVPHPLVLGAEDPTQYLEGMLYCGAIVGRFANRIGGGQFDLDGQRWQVDCNFRGTACLHGGSDGMAVQIWQIADITADRDDQERFFKELQNAIDYLDHAPAGFFSAGRKGEIFYLNATLSEWLGIDLTQFSPGAIYLKDLVAGEGMALIQSVQAEPGLSKTATLDLDLRRADGRSFPARLVHRVRSARDGAPGESRTIVLARQEVIAGDRSDSSASMRFTRFFNNTPMAIASVDGQGRILRTNAPFLKFFSDVVSR
ncbi:MAG: PAS domain-containing protein, partial [Gemmobacter sp.]